MPPITTPMRCARTSTRISAFPKPTALLLGRYQPFHDGHKALMIEAIDRVGQVCIAVRDTHGTDEKNPFSFEYVRSRIEHGLRAYEGRFNIILVPNVVSTSIRRYRRSRRPKNESKWELSESSTRTTARKGAHVFFGRGCGQSLWRAHLDARHEATGFHQRTPFQPSV
jgi:nicotinamide mononucleotide adenylyltransferase